MIVGVREFFRTSAGKYVAIGLVVVALAVLFFSVRSNLGDPVAAAANEPYFIDAATMQPFRHQLRAGEMVPVDAPSGGKTGYPAELCYWTKDGKIKDEPTPVLLKSWTGEKGATYCPECDRLVVERNPVPTPQMRPPPTAAERAARTSSWAH